MNSASIGRPDRGPPFLSRAAQLLSSSAAFDDALASTLAAALPDLGDFGFFDVVDGNAVRRMVAAYEAPDVEALLRPTQWVRQERRDMNLCALSSGAAALHPNIDDAWYAAVAAGPEHLDLLRKLAFRSMLTVPVHYRGELVGALTLFMARSGRRHDEEYFALAADLAALAAPIVVNARLLRQHERAQAALRDADATLRLAIEAGEMGIWEWDVASDRVSWSDGVYRLHGVAPGAFGGRVEDFSQLVHPDDQAEVGRRIQQALATGSSYEAEFRVPWPDRTNHWLATRAIVQRGDDGRALRMIGITYDVTARMQLLDAERRARAAADAASRAKDGFLAMLGHELRNPLAPIHTSLQMMALQAPDTFRRERSVIERQVGHLTRLVDDLLDIARITRGDLRLRHEPIVLRHALATALEMAGPLLEAREHVLDVQLPAEDLLVDGDADRLAQVFSNLLNNAARYTPQRGRIELRSRRDRGQVVIEVRDNGEGIHADLLPHVFELFAQGPQGPDRAAGGLGVGLAVARTLVIQHGGSITASSPGPGHGSTFAVRLPVSAAAAAPRPQDAAPLARPVATRRILIVDDNRDAAEMLSQLLRLMGHEVAQTLDPASALMAAKERTFDVAILDIGLPGMDGYELARRLRELPQQRQCRLVALSGYGQPADRAQSAQAGFAAHLVKPIDADLLARCLDSGERTPAV